MTDSELKNCEYICEYYGVPAQLNREVEYKGQRGIIIEDRGNYIGVNFYNDKPTSVMSIHPADDNLKYLSMGKPRKITQSQARYQEYINQDWFEGSFANWLGIKK
jgi:hypothetical protein